MLRTLARTFGFFREKVGPHEYIALFRDLLSRIVPERTIVSWGKTDDDWEAFLEPNINALIAHLLACQSLHNKLVAVIPPSPYRRAHRALITTAKSYLGALTDKTDALALLRPTCFDSARFRHHNYHGRQWDELAARCFHDLYRELARIRRRDPLAFDALIGSNERFEDLDDASDQTPDVDDLLAGLGLGGFFNWRL